MKIKTWIVVANSTYARIFTLESGRVLCEQETLVHPPSRMHEGDLVSDKQGKTFSSVGKGRNSMELNMPIKKHEAITFAKKVSTHLAAATSNGSFDRLYIAASPTFLGMLRQNLNTATVQRLEGEVDKDITHMKPEEICQYFPFGV